MQVSLCLSEKGPIWEAPSDIWGDGDVMPGPRHAAPSLASQALEGGPCQCARRHPCIPAFPRDASVLWGSHIIILWRRVHLWTHPVITVTATKQPTIKRRKDCDSNMQKIEINRQSTQCVVWVIVLLSGQISSPQPQSKWTEFSLRSTLTWPRTVAGRRFRDDTVTSG